MCAVSQSGGMQDTICRVAIDLSNSEFNELQNKLNEINSQIHTFIFLDSSYESYTYSSSFAVKVTQEFKLKREEFNTEIKRLTLERELIAERIRMLALSTLCPNQPMSVQTSMFVSGSGIIDSLDEFNNEISSHQNKTVLVALTAEWCTPCQTYLPDLRQFVAQHSDSLALIEIDYEHRSTIAHLVGSNYLPTVIVYQNSEPAARLEGTAGIAYFEAWLRAYLH